MAAQISLTQKTDYVEDGLSLLRQVFKGRPKMVATLTALLGAAQDIEDAIAQLGNGLLLENAQGVALDNLGALVGVSRHGLDDQTYRLLIYAQIAANHGDATLATLILLSEKLFSTDVVFVRTPLATRRDNGAQGAYVAIMVGSPQLPDSLYLLAQKLLNNNVAGGIALSWLGTFDAKKSFSFAGTRPWVGGFGSIKDAAAGAPMASLVSTALI